MGLQWPEDGAVPTQGRARGGPRFSGLVAHELFENDDEPGPKRRFAYLGPTLILIAVLVALGLVLAFGGPLPTVFPRLDCGACEIHN